MKVINRYNTSHNTNIQLTDSLERLISKYTWERFIAEYIASKLFLLHLPIDEDINIEDIADVIDRFDVVETFQRMYPAAEVNEWMHGCMDAFAYMCICTRAHVYMYICI